MFVSWANQIIFMFSRETVLMKKDGFCLLGNNWVSLFLNSMCLSPSEHDFQTLWLSTTYSRATQALHSCSTVALTLLLDSCRPVERLQEPPVLRLNVAAQTAELMKDKRNVEGPAVVVSWILHTLPGRKPWTLTKTSWVLWLRWSSSPRW